jgi:hypothetical protein
MFVVFVSFLKFVRCCDLLLWPIVVTYCCGQLLWPIVVAYCCDLLLWPIVVTYCCDLLLWPIFSVYINIRRFQWPRSLRRRSAAVRLLRLWVRIRPEAWMFVCCECCVLSSTGLCDGLISAPEKSYRLRFVVVCDLETSWIRSPWPTEGCRAKKNKIKK